MMEQAVDVMTSEVGDDQAGQRHEQDRSDMAARDHAADETPHSKTIFLKLTLQCNFISAV